MTDKGRVTVSDILRKLDVKELVADPALYVALAILAADVWPGLGAFAAQHELALKGVWLVLLGHYGVRATAVISKGRVLTRTVDALPPRSIREQIETKGQ